jgi:hypothetical protein
MVAWTTPRTWTNNETVTDTILNAHVRDNLTAIVSPPYVHVRATAATSIGTAVAAVVWDTEIADTDNMYAPGTPTRVTVNTAGLYLVQGGYGVASATANAVFSLQWMVTSTSAAISQAGSSVVIGATARSIMLHNSTFVRLYVNDYVSLGAFHTGATTPATSTTGSYTSWMQLRWMGP